MTLNIGGAPGGVNLDGVVHCEDFRAVNSALGAYRGQEKYNAAADINNDGVIDSKDLSILVSHLGQGMVCH